MLHNIDKAIIGKNVQEKEILLGNTGRPESSALLAEVGDYGYAIAVCGQKLVIVWTNADYAAEALECFNSELNNSNQAWLYRIWPEAN